MKSLGVLKAMNEVRAERASRRAHKRIPLGARVRLCREQNHPTRGHEFHEVIRYGTIIEHAPRVGKDAYHVQWDSEKPGTLDLEFACFQHEGQDVLIQVENTPENHGELWACDHPKEVMEADKARHGGAK